MARRISKAAARKEYGHLIEGGKEAAIEALTTNGVEDVDTIIGHLFPEEEEEKGTVKKTYEVWRLERENGKVSRLKKLRTVKMEEHRIEAMNEQKNNTLIEYVEA